MARLDLQRACICPRRVWSVIPITLALGLPVPVDASQIVPTSVNMRALERLARIDGIQCVPYARAASGIQIFGDAWTWWAQAKGRYGRGEAPRVGAVMAFRPFGHMVLGHVAAISRIVDARTVLLRHANWSPIDGRHGQIERDVPAVDVSPANDWSQVRVWFDPAQGLGSTSWPVRGFIYPGRARGMAPGANHGVRNDPIGAIIAAHGAQAGARSPRKAKLPMKSVPRPVPGGAVVAHFTTPFTLAAPRATRKSAHLAAAGSETP